MDTDTYESPEDDYAITFRAIREYIEAFGSTRLKTCFRMAIDGDGIPYATVDEYLSDPPQQRLARLCRIPNLGKKTAAELDELVKEFSRTNSERARHVNAQSGGDAENPLLAASAESEAPICDRYANLTTRERDVLDSRFGVRGQKKQTLQEIGQTLGVTRERIRQLERKALRKLQSPPIAQSWKQFVDHNMSSLMDTIFETKAVTKEPSRPSGELGLAVAVVYGNVRKFLTKEARRFEGYWVRPTLSVLEIQSARNRVAAVLRVDESLPLSIRELAETLEISWTTIEAAVTTLEGYKTYNGWIIRGRATPRVKRVVNILNLFHDRHVESPATLWAIKVAYWCNFSDKCTGRDLLLCLQERATHFANLRELGWVCLSAMPYGSTRRSIQQNKAQDVPDELYRQPVKAGHGLANRVYEMFERHGPLRLSDAARIFEVECPEYAVSSMYPMLVYFAVFLRFAPGVIGIQAHRRSAAIVSRAREILLKERDIDLYVLSRAAGPPSLRYPLWDLEMEQMWANWLVKKQDRHRLDALLRVSSIGHWRISETERMRWECLRGQCKKGVTAPPLRIFSERRIDTSMLKTALAAASIFGYVNWMYLNQALGWRIETTRVGLVLALLIRIGAFKPTGAWSEPHLMTSRGRQIYRSVFGRDIGAAESRKTIFDFLEERVGSGTEFGWAEQFGFQELLSQVTDLSGQDRNDRDGSDEEEGAIMESAYDGFMGDKIRQLIEGR